MIAYHGQQEIKDKYLARVRAHRAADELVQGTGWEDGKGCAIGCILEAYDHSRLPDEIGVYVELGHLADRLFELQTPADAQPWPEDFLAAIRPGADLSKVWPQWAVWMLLDPDHGVINHAKRDDARAAIERVAQLWRDGGTPEEFRQAWIAAAAASSAASSAAYAAAAAAAASSAASSAAYAAAVAADAAASSAASSSAAVAADAADAAGRKARAQWVTAACDELIALLEAA